MNTKLALCSLYAACLTSVYVAAYDPAPRWGQAAVLVNDALFIHGGKTDLSNSYSYTAAPNNNDILYLPLSAAFSIFDPPWQLLSTSENSSSAEGPFLAWHTLSAYNTSHVLLFGGEPGPNSPTVLVGISDSAYQLNIYNRLQPSWIQEPVAWAGEPIRRIHHSSTTTTSGNVLLIGGERADDSKIASSEHYIFSPEIPSFTTLPSIDGPPDITGHSSVMLPDGRLLVIGGYQPSSDELLPFSMIWVLETSRSPVTWSLTNVSDVPVPHPRRAFAATVIPGGKVLIQGGSDAALQANLDDGWVLDTSRSPMVWTQIDALSQIGARRDHFAVAYGDQVIFGLGYGNYRAAPADLQIFDIKSNSFVSGFTPLSPSSTPSQTLPSPSQTTTKGHGPSTSHSGTAVHPSNTVGSDPDNPTGGGGGGGGGGQSGDSKNSRTTAVVVGTILGVIGALAIGLACAYYLRRRERQAASGRRFIALQGSDGDEDTPYPASTIPVAGISELNKDRQGWNLGVLNPLGFSGLMAAATGARNARNVPERRDMLADEDTRDFGAWYEARQRDGTAGSSWSLKSIIGGRKRSREPSIAGSTGGVSWKEKSHSFSDTAAPMNDEETGYIGSSRPQGRRQMSYTSAKSYRDPFADPILEESTHDDDEETTSTQPFLHPIPPQLPTLRTILPISQGGHPLSPLSEHTSQHTLSAHDPSNSVSSHSTLHNSPFDASSSQVTSNTSLDPKSFTSSIIGAIPSNRPVKRSDSWWSRFSRTSFLDRRGSDSSRHRLEFRDPNPPPRLVAIEESTHSISPDRHSPGSQISNFQRHPSAISRHASRLQGGHNKSLTSVKTADTEAIERMAGAMDVAQLARSGSGRTASTGTTASWNADTRPNSWIHEDHVIGGSRTSETAIFTSPVEMVSTGPEAHPAPLTSPAAIVTSPKSMSKDNQPPSAGAVAARIQEFERRRTLDSESESPQSGEMRRHEESPNKRTQSRSVNYGLIPRASLYVANPDHRVSSSDDS